MSKQRQHVNDYMASIAPDLYRPTTDADRAIAARPIDGMRFAIDDSVRDRRNGKVGVVESCTLYPGEGLKYGVRFGGARQAIWVWEGHLELEGQAGGAATGSSVSAVRTPDVSPAPLRLQSRREYARQLDALHAICNKMRETDGAR